MWYIDAMILKGSAVIAVLLAVMQPSPPVFAQGAESPAANSQAAPLSPSTQTTNSSAPNWQLPPISTSLIRPAEIPGLPPASAQPPIPQNPLVQTPIAQTPVPQTPAPPPTATQIPAQQSPSPEDTGNPAPKADCVGAPCDDTPPHITVAEPPATLEPWTLHEQIAWAANLVLAILGYAGIVLAVSTLKKIERHTRSTQAIAEAAADSAQAALLNAQAIVDSGRPWLLISAEPSRSSENSFTVTATNRGRSPAKIISSMERIIIAIDEARLPTPPEYKSEEPGVPFVPIILLPGESTVIKPFCRDDLRAICETEESFKRVEYWEEKVFIYGKVIYKDLIATTGKQDHETAWCCWYIHGRQKSGLVIAGPPEYNVHT